MKVTFEEKRGVEVRVGKMFEVLMAWDGRLEVTMEKRFWVLPQEGGPVVSLVMASSFQVFLSLSSPLASASVPPQAAASDLPLKASPHPPFYLCPSSTSFLSPPRSVVLPCF